jgi:hypothetical protein
MQTIAVRDRDAGLAGLSLTEVPYPHAAENDVIVRGHAGGFTPGELGSAGTWTDRAGPDRTPSVPRHEVSDVVAELGYDTTGLTVGQRVFGLADWTHNGTLADYVAIEARNLAPLPAGGDHTVADGAVVFGLTAWQALFDHAHLLVGQTALIHSAGCGVVRTNRRSSARGSALFSSAGKAVTIEKSSRLPILGVEQSDRSMTMAGGTCSSCPTCISARSSADALSARQARPAAASPCRTRFPASAEAPYPRIAGASGAVTQDVLSNFPGQGSAVPAFISGGVSGSAVTATGAPSASTCTDVATSTSRVARGADTCVRARAGIHRSRRRRGCP